MQIPRQHMVFPIRQGLVTCIYKRSLIAAIVIVIEEMIHYRNGPKEGKKIGIVIRCECFKIKYLKWQRRIILDLT